MHRLLGRGPRIAVAGLLVALLPVLALTDFHLSSAPLALIVSTATAALAVPVLAAQPLLALAGRIGWHRALGGTALGLVLVHLGGLFVIGPGDTLFALSPDGPTRGRMAVLATLALIGVVLLGLTRDRLPIAATSWRILHAFLATLAIVLGIGHAVLTDGALDGAGTVILLSFGTIALAAVPAAYLARSARARRYSPSSRG